MAWLLCDFGLGIADFVRWARPPRQFYACWAMPHYLYFYSAACEAASCSSASQAAARAAGPLQRDAKSRQRDATVGESNISASAAAIVGPENLRTEISL